MELLARISIHDRLSTILKVKFRVSSEETPGEWGLEMMAAHHSSVAPVGEPPCLGNQMFVFYLPFRHDYMVTHSESQETITGFGSGENHDDEGPCER